MDGFNWSILLNLLAVILLVGANGFFVAAEFSLVAVRRSRIEQLKNEGHKIANDLEKASQHLDAYLAATQLGITLSSLALGWIGEPAIATLLHPLFANMPAPFDAIGSHGISMVIAFTFITILHIVLGELMPKSLAIQKAEMVSIAVVRPLAFFRFVFRPAIAVLNGLANWLLHKAGLQNASEEDHVHSPEELKLLFTAASRAGLIREAQGDLVNRALNIADRRIASCMTPHVDFQWIDPSAPLSDIRKLIIASPHTRFPVRTPESDEIGMVTAKSVLSIDPSKKTLPKNIIKPALIISENAPILRVIDQFRRDRIEFALAVDYYGEIQGLVTTHDLFDALAGDADALPIVGTENGEDENPLIEQRIFDAGISMDDFRQQLRRPNFGIHDKHSYHTVAGFVLERLKRIPEVGAGFDYDGLHFEVHTKTGHRITRVAVNSIEPIVKEAGKAGDEPES